MGAYLSKPNCEKVSEDCDGEYLRYGASSMQGWRISQEDAHCCIIDFDESTGTSLFGVYDGHGGAEVAQYTAEHFPGFLKSAKPYHESRLAAALEESFLGFDATLTSEEIKKKLAELAGGDSVEAANEDDNNDEKHEAAMLREEASMPIEELLERYGGANTVVNRPLTVIKRAAAKKSLSPMLRPKPNLLPDCAGGNRQEADSSESDQNICIKLAGSLPNGCLQRDLHENEDTIKSESNCGGSCTGNSEECVIDPNEKSADGKLTVVGIPSDTGDDKLQSLCSSSKATEVPSVAVVVGPRSNGTVSDSQTISSADVSSSNTKLPSLSEDVVSTSVNVTQSSQMSSTTSSDVGSSSSGIKLSSGDTTGDSSEEDDSEDEQWKEDDDDDDDDDSDEDGTTEELVFGDMDDDDDSSEEDSEDGDEEDEEMEGGMEFGDEPGADSGCTAVVALLRGNELYVANAGDSRCVLCRDGKAVEMSVDHKPEDQPEKDRIVHAGGRVTCDGRVNGGLNLSRAIGDHIYKRNKVVSDREQMITALPDVRSVTLDERDMFMVLACDGIWNVMSSQDVVDFVKRRLESGITKLSAICEEMFDFCLAPDTSGDGTGCDNMTCVIVTFDGLTSSVCRRTGIKRKASDSLNEKHENEEFDAASKRLKEDSV